MASLSLEKLIIPFSSLNHEDEMFEFFLRPDLYKEDETISFSSDIQVNARVQKVEDNYLLFLNVTGACKMICDRCGDSFTYPINSKINTLFSFSRLEDENDEDSEIRFIYSSDHGINIGQDVRDAIVLAIPSKQLCKKDCKGLCDQCGQNLNQDLCQCNKETTDPRWDALKSLKFDE